MRLFIFVLFIVFIGCDDGCKVKGTRCKNNVAQVCNSNNSWEDMDDCTRESEGLPFELKCEFDADYGQHVCVLGDVLFDAGVDAGW